LKNELACAVEESKLPAVIVTGASGFVGRYLIESLKQNYQVFAFARRTQREAQVPIHDNISWVLVDISQEEQLNKIITEISAQASIIYIIHLAAYYEFSNQPDQAYETTNVLGTQLLLEHAKGLKELKHFIFASSLVACKYPEPGEYVTELTPADATYPYADSKRKGENLMYEYSQYFPCASVRFAAVFSDCCEYLPLYYFLKTWLSNRWDANILAGRGETALPYIHINCVVALILQIIKRGKKLSAYECFLASPDQNVSHLELFNLANRYYSGERKHPLFVPKMCAWVTISLRDLVGRLIGRRPFERLWMVNYIDKRIDTDSTYTRERLHWQPKNRHTIQRRLLFMMENLKSSPIEWHQKNIARIVSPKAQRLNLELAEEMLMMRDEVVNQVLNYIRDSQRANIFRYYQSLDEERVRYYIEVLYNHLIGSVRNGDRSLMISFAQFLANVRFSEGVKKTELCTALNVTGQVITELLKQNRKLQKMQLLVHDYIILALQLAIDEVKDTYDLLKKEKNRKASNSNL